MNRSLALILLPVAVLALALHLTGWYAYGLLTGRWSRVALAIDATMTKLNAAARK